jgi:hypothetical protein
MAQETDRGQDIRYSQLSAARQKALQSRVNYSKAPSEVTQVVDYILPYMRQAVKVAENNGRNFGILSVTPRNPEHADKLLVESIQNNYYRWMKAGKPGPFVDFMRDRYAPIGEPRDKKNLNPNWNNNVRKSLLQQLGPEQYNVWQNKNLTQVPQTNAVYS